MPAAGARRAGRFAASSEEAVAAERPDAPRLAQACTVETKFRPRRTREGGRAGDDAANISSDAAAEPGEQEMISERRLYVVARKVVIQSRRLRLGQLEILEHYRSRCRPAPLSTKAWCWCGSLRPTTATCWTRVTKPPWRWSTSGSRPTRFRPGSLAPSVSSWWRTAGKSTTRCAASVNWMAARQASVMLGTFRRRYLEAAGRFPTRASRTRPALTTHSNFSFRAVIRSVTR